MAKTTRKPYVLAVLDGWGYSKKSIGNPISVANKPTFDKISANYPATLLQASGLAVGMTWGETGNSEVGHLNLGAGRLVEQYLSRITRSIGDESFFSNPAFVGAFEHTQKNNSKIHIIGLLTSGTVHAGFAHLIALIEMAKRQQIEVNLHLFLDGKDSGLQEAPELIGKLNEEIQKEGFAKIATAIGRNFAMDRDNNWDFTKAAYELLIKAAGEQSPDLVATIQKYYQEGKNDSVMPALVADAGFTGIADGDALIFFNFREDSMRQIVRPFIEQDFSQFERLQLNNIYVATMSQYLENPSEIVAFPAPPLVNVLAEVIDNSGLKQLHIAETEKYAHVTFFFNGLSNKVFSGETDIFIKSDKNHEEKPEMKCQEITDKIIEGIKEDAYDFIVLNFANADVLAHTGNLEATTKGIETVDLMIGIIMEEVLAKDGVLFITADHGNGESLLYKAGGEPETKHNLNPVPFYVIGSQFQSPKSNTELNEVAGILSDVAPTILEVMGISQPEEMTGNSLLSSLLPK
jgi:2,3-bisphosphoglycerate-independent phosphoglycerate mutase